MSKSKYQPWRCLWRGSTQITRTTPLRRTILHLLQIFLTDARTFMICLQTANGHSGPGLAHSFIYGRCLYRQGYFDRFS